ncbi:MAG: uroporphyrinogen decarboxylase family protein, partial [Proteobacteria bacterium]|nr:uroporphyrinogen decarboxylase family protein [Pseudomonadota bacterium]
MEYLEEEIPVVIERPLEENPDFSRLPELAPGSGRVDAVTGEVRIISSELGSTVLVGSAFSGPFTTAMELRGLPQALEDMEDNPDYLRGLMDFTTKQITRYVDLLMEAGAVGLVMLEPLCSADCMPPDIYKKWALPWQSQIFEYIKDKGRVPVIHICTYTEPLWEAMAGSGALAYHGDIHPSLLECKKEIGAKICLIGNVNPVDVLLNGTPEQVAAASERCIRQAAPGGGFVLAAGCDTGYRTPGENLAAMVETARRSTYPLA